LRKAKSFPPCRTRADRRPSHPSVPLPSGVEAETVGPETTERAFGNLRIRKTCCRTIAYKKNAQSRRTTKSSRSSSPESRKGTDIRALIESLRRRVPRLQGEPIPSRVVRCDSALESRFAAGADVLVRNLFTHPPELAHLPEEDRFLVPLRSLPSDNEKFVFVAKSEDTVDRNCPTTTPRTRSAG